MSNLPFSAHLDEDNRDDGVSGHQYPCKYCHRVLITHGALTTHQQACQGMKRELSSVLSDMAGIFHSRKKRRVEEQGTWCTSMIPFPALSSPANVMRPPQRNILPPLNVLTPLLLRCLVTQVPHQSRPQAHHTLLSQA